ncbi:MAG TPA: hypothetical protein VLH56_19290 [Dissulfurispiraceae bacterium]|nr:hypothetical protein [Dissulfurispiraceae bacterium]
MVGTEYMPTERMKIFKIRDVVFGGAGSARAGEILKQTLDITPYNEFNDTPDAYAFDIANRVGALLHDYHEAAEDKNERACSTYWLIAFGRHLYNIGSEYCITEITGDFYSIGIGSSYALGALDILCKIPGYKPKQVGYAAMETSAKFTYGIRPPYVALWTTPLE